jgi:glycosyl transferase, family 25
MDAHILHPFWQQIAGVLVINLDQRTDRWAEVQAAAHGVIPSGKLHRISARLGRDIPGFGPRPWFRGGLRDRNWAGRAECIQSHCLAQAAGRAKTLVLEEDAGLPPNFSRVLDPLTQALAQHDWQMCYLGFTNLLSSHRRLDATHALYQTHGCITTHAYLIRAAARDWVLTQLPDFPVTCVAPGLISQVDDQCRGWTRRWFGF